MVETCLMKVVVDMGSYGVRWGHRGWLKIKNMNDADFVDDRTGPFGFIGGQRGSEGTIGGGVI